MKRFMLSLVLFLLFISSTFAQYSSARYRGEVLMGSNSVLTILYNYGLIGNVGEFSFVWPQGTSNEYVGDYTPLVGAKFVHPCGDTLTSVITCLSPRQSPEYDPFGVFMGFEPVPGYGGMNIEQNDTTYLVACTANPSSWPYSWPNRDESWDGQWIGVEGPGELLAGEESYFVMDDHNDHEFRVRYDAMNNPYTLYPFPDDTTRGGLGLEMEVYNFQFYLNNMDDSFITMYILHNVGEVEFLELRFGALYGTLMGGRIDSEDDWTVMHESLPIVLSFDSDDNAGAGWVPVEEGVVNVGTMGTFFLDTPQDIGLTGLHAFSPPGAVRMNDDYGLWNRMNIGDFESNQNPEDGDYIMSSGGISFSPGEVDTFIVVTCFGRDIEDIENKYNIINEFYNNGWYLSVPEPEIPTTAEIMSLYPNPFNSVVRLKVALPQMAETKVEIYNLQGQRVAILNDVMLERGTYDFTWNAENFATGMYFVNLNVGGQVQTRKILLMK